MFLAHSDWQWHRGTTVWPFYKLLWCQHKSYWLTWLISSLETSKDAQDSDFNDLRQSKLYLQRINKHIKCWNKMHLPSAYCKGWEQLWIQSSSPQANWNPWLWETLKGSCTGMLDEDPSSDCIWRWTDFHLYWTECKKSHLKMCDVHPWPFWIFITHVRIPGARTAPLHTQWLLKTGC